jgi:hypothetical protein
MQTHSVAQFLHRQQDTPAQTNTSRETGTHQSARKRERRPLERAQDVSSHGASACIAVQSFLGLAMLLGPSSSSHTPRQVFLGLTMASTGLLTAAIQLAIGHSWLKSIPCGNRFTWDQVKGCHRQVPAMRADHELVGHALPGLLVCFWLAITISVFWPW